MGLKDIIIQSPIYFFLLFILLLIFIAVILAKKSTKKKRNSVRDKLRNIDKRIVGNKNMEKRARRRIWKWCDKLIFNVFFLLVHSSARASWLFYCFVPSLDWYVVEHLCINAMVFFAEIGFTKKICSSKVHL